MRVHRMKLVFNNIISCGRNLNSNSKLFTKASCSRSIDFSFSPNIFSDSEKREELTSKLRDCLLDPGYFYLDPQPYIEAELLAKAYNHTVAFHSLPSDIKSKYRTDLNKNSRGWVPLLSEPSYEAGKISYVESFDLALDVPSYDPLSELPEIGPNVYPDDELPQFRPDITQLYDNTTELADITFQLIAEAAGLHKDSFLQYATRKRRSHMRLLSYPGSSILMPRSQPQKAKIPFMITSAMRDQLKKKGFAPEDIKNMTPEEAQQVLSPVVVTEDGNAVTILRDSDVNSVATEYTDNAVGISAHTDFECFTFLHQNASGLQLQSRAGSWIDADPPLSDNGVPYFTVIIGDVIEMWTNGYFRATPHRVPMVDHPRVSIVRFNGVDSEVLISPLPSFENTQQGNRMNYIPVTQGEHINAMMSSGLQNLEDLHKKGVLPKL